MQSFRLADMTEDRRDVTGIPDGNVMVAEVVLSGNQAALETHFVVDSQRPYSVMGIACLTASHDISSVATTLEMRQSHYARLSANGLPAAIVEAEITLKGIPGSAVVNLSIGRGDEAGKCWLGRDFLEARDRAAARGAQKTGERVVIHDKILLPMHTSSTLTPDDNNEWNDAKNARRCSLVNKKYEYGLSMAETEELDCLQAALSMYRRKHAPLPLEWARQLHQDLMNEHRRKSGG